MRIEKLFVTMLLLALAVPAMAQDRTVDLTIRHYGKLSVRAQDPYRRIVPDWGVGRSPYYVRSGGPLWMRSAYWTGSYGDRLAQPQICVDKAERIPVVVRYDVIGYDGGGFPIYGPPRFDGTVDSLGVRHAYGLTVPRRVMPPDDINAERLKR